MVFYEGLEADNTKAYWQAHKGVYDECVRAPMEALLAELEPEFGAAKVFRPYRDVRFSADKSPYKSAIGASLEKGGYVQLSADGLMAGCGMYHMTSDQLQRFRLAVADDEAGGNLAALLGRLRQKGIEVAAHESLKTAPRGFPRDHPRADLLRQKGLITHQSWPAGPDVATPSPKRWVVTFLRASQPVQQWLDRHVGPSRSQPERR